MSINQKLDRIYEIKQRIAFALQCQGYSLEDIGTMLADVPRLIQQFEAHAIVKYPQWFLDTLVCWYDLMRQGLTNAQIQAQNKSQGFFWIRDLNPQPKGIDGKWCDMKGYNFAGEGMSGMGGYGISFIGNIGLNNFSYGSVVSTTENRFEFTINAKGLNIGDAPLFLRTKKLKVVKLKENNYHWILMDPNKAVIAKMSPGVPIVIDNSKDEFTFEAISFRVDDKIPAGTNVVFEQLALYEGALCFDGVDDYAINRDMPILDDYTLIYEEANIGGRNSIIKYDGFTSVGKNVNDVLIAYSFGATTILQNSYVIEPSRNIYHQTKNKFLDISINSGTLKDGKVMRIGGSLSNMNSTAFYSSLLFNKTLEQEQLLWTRANIMGEYIPGQRNMETAIINEILGY